MLKQTQDAPARTILRSNLRRQGGWGPALRIAWGNRAPRKRARTGTVLGSVFLLGLASSAGAETLDPSKLPPASEQKIEFSRDIKPLLEGSCLKCHSDEKPKSNFRLTSREAALKGGSHGIDILPGQSARSPLIYYVARLVEEMEMPPEGRGKPLTSEQVGLLRAWVDQGLTWEPALKEPPEVVSGGVSAGRTAITGDTNKFRELYWQREGWNGGLEDFELVGRPGPDSKITTAGHVLVDDYKLKLEAQQNDLGFAHFGWTQYRKYFDDTGGYSPRFSPGSFNLGRDLHLDVGRAWADFGLTLPDWPRLVLGYESQYRNGTESTLQWGPVSNGTLTNNIYPAVKELSERVHILKFDADYDLAGVSLSDSFRGEWLRLATDELDESAYTLGSSGMAFTSVQEKQSYFQGANSFHAEKQFAEWLFGAGGYLYSKLNASGSMDVQTLNPQNLFPDANAVWLWNAQPLELERESHVFSLSTLLGPWEGFSLNAGVQNEWTRQTGLATASNALAAPYFPPPTYALGFPTPEELSSALDRRLFSQEVGVRFSKLPFTTLFAEARFQQDAVGQFQQEFNGPTQFLLNTDSSGHLTDYRAGFNTSPWRRVSLNAQYRRYENETDYANQKATLQNLSGNNFIPGPPFPGYPGFIRWRDLLTDEAETRLAFQANSWLKTSLSYQWLQTRYRTATDPADGFDPLTSLPFNITPGSSLLAGKSDSRIAGFNATLTPWRRWAISTTFSYQNTRTTTSANDSPSLAPFAGNLYSAVVSAHYALNDKTSLDAGYDFSFGDFAQANRTDSIPLGINYHQHALQAGIKRQLGPGKTVGLQYRFYHYDEPSSGGVNNFEAHALFATLSWRWP